MAFRNSLTTIFLCLFIRFLPARGRSSFADIRLGVASAASRPPATAISASLNSLTTASVDVGGDNIVATSACLCRVRCFDSLHLIRIGFSESFFSRLLRWFTVVISPHAFLEAQLCRLLSKYSSYFTFFFISRLQGVHNFKPINLTIKALSPFF